MALYTLSDTHLSLADNKPMDVFGKRWTGYLTKLEEGWRSVVTDDDTVVVAGDISWAMTLEGALADLSFLDSLPGKKLIGRGNHDYWWSTMQKLNKFKEENRLSSLDFLYNNAFEREGFVICGARGWFTDEKNSPKDTEYKKIILREVGRIELSLRDAADMNGEKLMFLHFPPVFRDYVCPEIIDCLKANGIRRCFYGHIHNAYDFPKSFEYDGIEFCVTSADYFNFVPQKIG